MVKRFLNSTLIVLTGFTGYAFGIINDLKSQINSYIERPKKLALTVKEKEGFFGNAGHQTGETGGAEMARFFVSQPTGSTSVAGILITPHTEKLNRATNLPSENLWSQYVMLDEPTNNNGGKS